MLNTHPSNKASGNIIRTACAALLIGSLLFAGGCASIVHGGNRTVNISSQPAGAKVTITKADTGAFVYSGTTPLTVSLDPRGGYFEGQSYSVCFALNGYQTEEVVLRPRLSGWYVGNIVFGGLVGILIVDPLTGSMWNLSPDQIDQTLTSNQAAVLRTGKGFVVTLLADTTAEERARMVKIN